MRRQISCKPLAERFWAKVQKTHGCWLWTANCTKDKEGNRRNGLIGAGRRGDGMLFAQRVSWEMHNGAIPEGMLVLHVCDNPQCVRPTHLFLGTQSDNMQDMVRKERQGKTGPAPGTGAKSKLSQRQLATLRKDGASGVSKEELAARYGVCVSTVRNILLRLTNQNR